MDKIIKYIKSVEKKLEEIAWDLLDDDALNELNDEQQDELCVIYHELQSVKHKMVILGRKYERIGWDSDE
jgi:hypothetical protein